LATPTRIGLDAAGDLLISVQGLNVERIVAKTTCPSSCAFGLSSTTADHIYTVAGQVNVSGYSGDGGPATSAQIANPNSAVVDAGGDLLVTDPANNVLRMVAAADCASSCAFGLSATTAGDIYTVAGNGRSSGYSGDGAAANGAELNTPAAVTVDSAGNLLIADHNNNAIRLVAATTCASSCAYGLSPTTAGDIYTVAGDGTGNSGYSGDGGPAGAAQLDDPNGVAVDGAGDLIISDQYNYAVRMVAATSC